MPRDDGVRNRSLHSIINSFSLSIVYGIYIMEMTKSILKGQPVANSFSMSKDLHLVVYC